MLTHDFLLLVLRMKYNDISNYKCEQDYIRKTTIIYAFYGI